MPDEDIAMSGMEKENSAMTDLLEKNKKLLEEIVELRLQRDEAEQTLEAIRSGSVDALVVTGPQGDQVFSLTGAEHVYRVIIEAMNEGALTMDLGGYILFCNRRFCEMVQRPMAEVIGRRLTNFTTIQQQPVIRQLVADAQAGPVRRNFLLQASDGTFMSVLLSANLLVAANPPCICMVVGDLTELETSADSIRRLREQQEALEAANKELESFSYSVSHDLRAPLRAIDGYSRIILRKHADNLGEDVRSKLNVIVNSSQRMGQLIEDLLTLSRLGRAQLSMAQLDMGVMIREVWEEIQAANAGRSLKLTMGTIPPAVGDRGLIRQVLVNLISNAVKFSRQRPEASIEVFGFLKDSECIYTVRDNGVGFDMQYRDKLFGVFQRLHTTQEFEGTGVGLSIVQRIVHRHHGRIWAEGEVGKGATFYFTIPTSQG
jgi:PAS domain S-box-containing protein